MRAAILLLVAVCAAPLSACGDDSSPNAETASASICAARDDIQRQLETLNGMSVSTATGDAIRASVEAIRDDVATIAEGAGDLSAQRRADVADANAAFADEVRAIASDLGGSLSLGNARAQLEQAVEHLAGVYRSSLGTIDCAAA